jgi:hypothetical protein
MDNKALAESMTDLYLYIQDHAEKKLGVMPTTEQVNIIFIECSKMIMTETIGKQRSGVPHKEETRSEEKPTEKQIAFATRLGCHNPEGFGKKELSAWIEENKTF